MHPRARCTTLPTGRKAVVQKIYRHVSQFQQLCKSVSTLVEWTAAPDLNIPHRPMLYVQRVDAAYTVANPFSTSCAPVEVGTDGGTTLRRLNERLFEYLPTA